MAVRTATLALRLFHWKKSELILRSMPKHDNYKMITEYQQTLKDLKISNRNEALGLVSFPLNSFGNYPKDVLKKLIDESVHTIKRNNMVNSHTYNAIIKSYVDNGIQFNLVDILKDMVDNRVDLNLSTYYILIEFYCQQGDMGTVEKLLGMIKLKNFKIDKMKLLPLITGYIISGQTQKSVKFLKSDDFEENNVNVLLCEARGYASLGDINRVLKIIDKIKTIESNPPQIIYFQLYQLLVEANVSDYDLEPILQLMIQNKQKQLVYKTIFGLNRAGCYSHSLKLMRIFSYTVFDRYRINDLMTSFNSPDCPINVYESILGDLVDLLDAKFHKNIFCNMSYDEAFEIAQNLINSSNCNVIFPSLMNKAISDKSLLSIQTTLEFGYENLTPLRLNSSLQFDFIPTILQSGMVGSFREILDLLPQYRSTILPLVLMHNLCIGDFCEYTNLMIYHDSPYPLFYMMNLKNITHQIMQHVSFKEVEKLIVEASKVFHTSLVNKLLSSYVIERIVSSSHRAAVQDIKDAVRLAENFSVTFTSSEFQGLKYAAQRHLDLLQSLSTRIVNKKLPVGKVKENSNVSESTIQV